MTDQARIQRLEDLEEIRLIFTDYARFLDGGDHAGYAQLFASNGVLVAQLGEAVGPVEIERILDENLGPQVRGHLPRAVHVMSNQRTEIDGDTGTTEVTWFYLTTDSDGVPIVLQTGLYTDELVRENGAWKLARHDITRIMGRSPMDPAPRTRLDIVEERLQRLEDKDAIWGLFMDYKEHLDARDFAAYASLFTEDAEWVGNLGKVIGPAQIEEMLVDTLDVWDSDTERVYHLVLNPVINIDGDTATAESTWSFVTRGKDDAPVVEMLGRYLDELRRTPDGWRFSRRVAYSDIPYIDLSDVKAHAAPYIVSPD